MKVASVKTRIQLGVFVLILAGVVAICIMVAGDDISLFRRSTAFIAKFTNTAGLVEGAPVRMGGVEIGRVDKIRIETTEEKTSITATLKIDTPYDKLIRSDATATLETQGVLGDKFVALNPGQSSTSLQEGMQIQTKEDQGMAQVMAKSSDIVDSVARTTKKIDDFATGLPDATILKAMINDLAASARSLKEVISHVNDKGTVLAALQGKENVATLEEGLRHFSSAASHVDSIARKIDEGQGTLGALVNDRTLYEDLRAKLGQADRGRVARRAFQQGVGPLPLKSGAPDTP